MTIDLIALAKKADETYLDVETSFGKLRVYLVPDVRLLSVGPDRPEPILPLIGMKTATGVQDRQAKPGDPEHEQYLKDLAKYQEEGLDLRIAVGTVMALRDIDWRKYDLTGPPPSKEAQEMYKNKWPDHDLLRKKAWLDWSILFVRKDQDIILEAINKMNGSAEPTDAMVDEVKKNSASSLELNQKG